VKSDMTIEVYGLFLRFCINWIFFAICIMLIYAWRRSNVLLLPCGVNRPWLVWTVANRG
jgi:hypothetical protein